MTTANKTGVALCALLAAACSHPGSALPGVELSLAEMQTLFPAVSNPPPEWNVSPAELRGQEFELFDKEVILGVFHLPANDLANGERSSVHVVAPNARVKLNWVSDAGPADSMTFGPTTQADCSAYFEASLHSSTISVEVSELNGVACSRKAKLEIR